MKLTFKVDSRNLNFFQKFGQVTSLPDELIFDSSLADFVQPIGDVMCTAIAVCEITTDKTNKTYDHVELFNRIPSTKEGAEPKQAIKAGIEYLKLLAGGTEKPWSSYWQAHTGRYDAFDNCRSAIGLAQNSIEIWTPWFANWSNKTILPKGENILNYHAYHLEGWKMVNGVPMMQVEMNVGYKVYMTREVFNHALSAWASGTAVMSTSEIDAKREKTILEALIDVYKNIIITLQLLINQQKVTPIADPTPVPSSTENKNEALYDLSYSLIDKHLTLNPTIDKSVGCAQAVSFVLKKAGYEIPRGGISGTSTLCDWLKLNFTEISSPQKGCVLIFVTGTGKPGTRGHVFIYGKTHLMSNDSDTGMWNAKWLIANAMHYYGTTLGMKPRYFNPT